MRWTQGNGYTGFKPTAWTLANPFTRSLPIPRRFSRVRTRLPGSSFRLIPLTRSTHPQSGIDELFDDIRSTGETTLRRTLLLQRTRFIFHSRSFALR